MIEKKPHLFKFTPFYWEFLSMLCKTIKHISIAKMLGVKIDE